MLTSCARSTSNFLDFAAAADKLQQRRELRDKLQQRREQNSTDLASTELASYDPSWQFRIDNAHRKRSALVVENLLLKLDGMRGQLLPHMLPPDLEAFGVPGLQGSAVKAKAATRSLLSAGDFKASNRGGIGSRGSVLGDASSPKTRPVSKQEAKVTAESLAIRERAQRRLRIFKGVMRTLMVFLMHKKKSRNVESIKLFLVQIGEWARIRSAVKSLVGNIRIMQRCCRECLASKRKRCEELSKVWERVETHFLSEYFKKYAKKILQESNAASQDLQTTGSPKKGRSKQDLQKTRSEALIKEALEQAGVDTASFAENSIDWKALRIPKEDRREWISRHYMSRLKQHVRDQKKAMETAQKAVQQQKELNLFLRGFGADESAVVKGVLCGQDLGQSVALKFWELNEDMTLDLIACAANSLRNQKPYHLHPANTDVSGEFEMRRAAKARGASKGSTKSRSGAAGGGGGAGAGTGRPAKRSGNEAASVDSPAVRRKNSKLDVEEILKRLTPRFREMQETAANASIEGFDNGTVLHGKGVSLPTPDAKNFQLARFALHTSPL